MPFPIRENRNGPQAVPYNICIIIILFNIDLKTWRICFIVKSFTIKTITAIVSAGIEATGYAENLWLQGEIDKTMRPQYAQEYIEIILERANIKVTDNITTILSGVIALTCYLMPHYSEENKEEE